MVSIRTERIVKNMTATKWNDVGDNMFCIKQLITCNRVKECNGVCPFEDALKHADKTQTINEQHTVDHDREWDKAKGGNNNGKDWNRNADR